MLKKLLLTTSLLAMTSAAFAAGKAYKCTWDKELEPIQIVLPETLSAQSEGLGGIGSLTQHKGGQRTAAVPCMFLTFTSKEEQEVSAKKLRAEIDELKILPANPSIPADYINFLEASLPYYSSPGTTYVIYPTTSPTMLFNDVLLSISMFSETLELRKASCQAE